MNKKHHYFNLLLATCMSLGLLLVVAVGTVSAHASVISSNPGAGTTIAHVPTTIAVVTAENMTTDPTQTNLFVYGPKGDVVSQGDAKVDINNPQHMSVAIKTTAGNGVYVVRWITKSALDGDPDAGAFFFTVKPVAAATSNTTVNSNTSMVPLVIAAIIALLVGLGAGFALGRTRPATTSASTTGNNESTQKQEETTSSTSTATK